MSCFYTYILKFLHDIQSLYIYMLYRNILMIWSTINRATYLWNEPHICVKRLVFIGTQLIKEYISTINGLIKIILAIKQDLI